MYERFTDRARKIMQLANEEARRFNHEYIGTEHILLGLVKEGSGVAALMLKNLDVDLRKIRLEVEKLFVKGPDMVLGHLPKTPRARQVIDYSMEEAQSLGHDHVGSEHLLLGLLREQEGVAAQVLMNLGLNLEAVRTEIRKLPGWPLDSGAQIRKDQGGVSPRVCPKCGKARAVRVLWGWARFHLDNGEDIAAGRAILGARSAKRQPTWVCLQCAPRWSEVHRFALQEHEWLLAKEDSVALGERETAAKCRDAQDKVRCQLDSLIEELLRDS